MPLRPTAVPLLAALLAGPVATAAHADGEFLQLDGGGDDLSIVAAGTRGRGSASLVFARYEGGDETTFSVTYAFPLDVGPGVTFRFGPSMQLDDGDILAGAKAQVESYVPVSFGGVFLQGEVNSIKSSYFGLAQVSDDFSGIAGELTVVGNDTGYDDHGVAFSYRLGQSDWRLRLGHKFQSDQTFVGISLNTY